MPPSRRGPSDRPQDEVEQHSAPLARQITNKSVYQSVIADWFGGDPVPVLGSSFPALRLFR